MQHGKAVGRYWHTGEVPAHTCSHCGYTGFVSPSEQVLDDYYSNHYGVHAQSWYNLDADYALPKTSSRASGVQMLLSRYLESVPCPVTLEIGCAFGGTVYELRKRNIAAFGVDLNSTAINEGRIFGNQYIFCKYAQTLMDELDMPTNLVYSYHALEHITDPKEFLVSLHKILAADSVLEFRVPNGSYFKAWSKGFDTWDWFAYPDHLHLLTPFSAWHLADSAGYDVLSMESDSCGETIESLGTWLDCPAHPEYLPVLQKSLASSMMLQELRFHLTPKGSSTSQQFTSLIKEVESRCKNNIAAELALRSMSNI